MLASGVTCHANHCEGYAPIIPNNFLCSVLSIVVCVTEIHGVYLSGCLKTDRLGQIPIACL